MDSSQHTTLMGDSYSEKEPASEPTAQYTHPLWRHSLPFVKPKHPPPPPPATLDDAPVIPDITANWFDYLFLNWISPLMALGSARPLDDRDLWKIDDARSAKAYSAKLLGAYRRRTQKANEKNARMLDSTIPLPFTRRILYSISPNGQRKEKEYREKHANKRASLFMSLGDTFGVYFAIAGALKLFADVCAAVSPLLVRRLITLAGEYQASKQAGLGEPSKGDGVGAAIGLLVLLLASSFAMHHYMYMGMSVGVWSRTAIVTSIYQQALQFTQKSRGLIPNGKLVNHISTDTSRIDFAAGLFHMLWTSPIQMVIIIIILIVQIGYSALPGIGLLLITTPFQAYLMKFLFTYRGKAAKWTDKRAKILQEALGSMRIVKYMAWEAPFLDRIHGFRKMELKYIRQLLTLRAGIMAFATSLPVLASILSFVTYSLTSHSLEAAKIFTVITLFQLLRLPLAIWPMALSSTADALNALSRLEGVFDAELITETRRLDPKMEEAIKLEHATFTWDAAPEEDDGKKKGSGTKQGKEAKVVENEEKPQKAIFQLADITLDIPKGSLTAIVGPIGSGKSSLLQGLMGEMRRTTGSVTFSGSTALCAQSPWIQNATVRENILFGQPFDEERYWNTIRDASLEADLELLDDGDSTQIGEKGINLSGGQKQRINIARAIYFDADIIALDDPLSALDAGVGKAVFFDAILGALEGKTRILVTHALHFLPHVDNIITMEDGKIGEVGTYQELKGRPDGAFARLIRDFGGEDQAEEEMEEEEEAVEAAGVKRVYNREDMVAKGKSHTLMTVEERNTGNLTKGTFWGYFKAGHGLITLPIVLFAVVLAQAITVITSFWLVWWEELKWPESNGFYMGIYAGLGFGTAFSMFFQMFSIAMLNYFASVRIHASAIRRVMYAPQSFFDTTPLGRILNRFGKDMDTVDNTLPDALRMGVGTGAQIVGAFILLAIIEPWFLIAVAVVILLYIHCTMFYRRSSREFKRIDSILRSSLYAHFSESLSGVATIRSYGETERFCRDNIYAMDTENRAYFLTVVNQRWLGLRLDLIGSFLVFAVALIVVCSDISASNSGLGLSTIVTVQSSFAWLVRNIAEVENDMVGAERILHYANTLEQEQPHQIEETRPPTSWPSEGRIEFKDVRMRYRPELPDVLKGLTLSVGASEKIGVVGRTGAGKSSIMVALFRMSELSQGSITIDGIDLSKIGLNDLRSGISIIPQDPLLFSGTLRSNIDPFDTKTDAELYDTLRRAHLITPTDGIAADSTRFRLDTTIEEEGGNLSVGERSLVSLARALVRDTKVLVLDEATASVDLETDAKIQETIRSEFKDRTLLCIAHRLKTILSYDRILVMSDGQVAELDTPENLFLMDGIFREMCSKANISLGDIQVAAALSRP
ncbi:hypothetical protein B9479_005847 [Cryptococcus floricola]|uniref:ATP-binding cassette transporter YOR1 n=1 Tax=Cryptococcus floricola TaxID=2591691 RepID=A0A5D3AUP6_9TREE|nr:hypothetical protein B9479_005847 [Cryptococcus floricola]